MLVALSVAFATSIVASIAIILTGRVIIRFQPNNFSQLKNYIINTPLSKKILKIIDTPARAKTKRELAKGIQRVIDLLRLYISGGQNLEMAIESVAANISGAWQSELQKMVSRLQVGLPFKQILHQSAEELNLPDFNRLILAIEQSRNLGVSLSGTLGVQSNLLRQRRKQQAETQARTASVKISLPLVLCIFPALLIVYLAPAALRLMGGI